MLKKLGIDKAIVEEVLKQATPVDRLHIGRKTRLAQLKETIELPDGALPHIKMPSWNRLQLDDKLPAPKFPKNSYFFTRGRICEPLHRIGKKFQLDDPLNRDGGGIPEYNALHDPTAESYFQNPSVQKQLMKQGLVTANGNVVCGLTDFNKWRAYLNQTIYKSKLRDSIQKLSEAKIANHAQKKQFDEYMLEQSQLNKNSKRILRLNRARELKLSQQKELDKKYKERQKLKEERVKRCKINLTLRHYDKIVRAVHTEERQSRKFNKVIQRQFFRRNQMMLKIQEKEKYAKERKEELQILIAQAKEKQILESISKHFQSQEATNVKEAILQNHLTKEFRKTTANRQRMFEKLQNSISQRNMAKEKMKEREELLARKYLEKWANFVIDRQLGRFLNPRHTSFNLMEDLEETVDILVSKTSQCTTANTQPSEDSISNELECPKCPTASNENVANQHFRPIKIKNRNKCKKIRSKTKFISKKSARMLEAAKLRKTAKLFVDETIKLVVADAKKVCEISIGRLSSLQDNDRPPKKEHETSSGSQSGQIAEDSGANFSSEDELSKFFSNEDLHEETVGHIADEKDDSERLLEVVHQTRIQLESSASEDSLSDLMEKEGIFSTYTKFADKICDKLKPRPSEIPRGRVSKLIHTFEHTKASNFKLNKSTSDMTVKLGSSKTAKSPKQSKDSVKKFSHLKESTSPKAKNQSSNENLVAPQSLPSIVEEPIDLNQELTVHEMLPEPPGAGGDLCQEKSPTDPSFVVESAGGDQKVDKEKILLRLLQSNKKPRMQPIQSSLERLVPSFKPSSTVDFLNGNKDLLQMGSEKKRLNLPFLNIQKESISELKLPILVPPAEDIGPETDNFKISSVVKLPPVELPFEGNESETIAENTNKSEVPISLPPIDQCTASSNELVEEVNAAEPISPNKLSKAVLEKESENRPLTPSLGKIFSYIEARLQSRVLENVLAVLPVINIKKPEVVGDTDRLFKVASRTIQLTVGEFHDFKKPSDISKNPVMFQNFEKFVDRIAKTITSLVICDLAQ